MSKSIERLKFTDDEIAFEDSISTINYVLVYAICNKSKEGIFNERREVMVIRNVQTNIRMTVEEKKLIRNEAKKANMNFADYVILSALNNETVVIDGIKDFTHKLSEVGTNLNQLTILCHQGKVICPDITEVNKLMNELWEYLVSLRKHKK